MRNADKFEVVQDVSLTIHEGEIFAVAGVAGNGQGELANTIAGMQDAYKGTITLEGKDITGETVRNRVEDGIAYIPEDRQGMGVFMNLPLDENLALRRYYKEPFSKRGVIDHGKIGEFADDLIGRYDIRSGQGGRTITRSMSGGNQQKAIVAREIEQHARLLIFVQPTRGMDMGAIEHIHEQIIAERDRGAAVLLISLELDEVMQLADTIGVIYNGKLLKTAPASTMTSQEVGRYMMGVADND